MARDNVIWREEFLAEHADWQVYHVESERGWRAVRESTDTVLKSHDLGVVLAMAERRLTEETKLRC